MNSVNFAIQLRRVLSFVISAVLLALTGSANQKALDGIYPFESVERTVLSEARERSMGVTTDGESWTFSGKSSITRLSPDGKTVQALLKNAVPSGGASMGALSFGHGNVYAVVHSLGGNKPMCALYDADSLEHIRTVSFPGSRDLAMVSFDEKNNCLYTASTGTINTLSCYAEDSFAFIKTVTLSMSVSDVVGGEIYDGFLYLATNDATSAVYRVRLSDGKTEKYLDRFSASNGGEGRDLTVFPVPDGTAIHALNSGAMGMDMNFRHYKWNPAFDHTNYLHDFEAGSRYAYAYAGFMPQNADTDISDWRLLLVNRNYILPRDYDLSLSEAVKGSGVQMDSRIAPFYQQMYDAAKKDGIVLTPLSGNRRISTQTTNFENKIASYRNMGYSRVEATCLAAKIILPPATSEHNAGLAMDILSLDVDFEETAAFRWLQNHAADYGFILRYPKDKEAVTEITYEPWHWRYVGVDNAKKINASGLCLEEYLSIYGA